MMRLLLTSLLLFFATLGPAHADPKLFGLFWGMSYPKDQPLQYYYENPKWAQPASAAADTRNFNSGDWLSQRPTVRHMIVEWKANDIFKGLTTNCDDANVIIVGPNFYHLSYTDKYRVIASLSDIYGLTKYKPGLTYIADKETCTSGIIGTFDASHGLLLR